MGNSTPCKIVTPKNFNFKLCTRDYVGRETTHHANFGCNRYSGGFSSSMQNITTLSLLLTVLSCPVLSCPVLLCDVLSCPFILGNAPRSNRWTDFHALWLKRRRVFAQGSAF